MGSDATPWRALLPVGMAAFISLMCFRLAEDGIIAGGRMLGTLGLAVTFYLAARYLDLFQAATAQRGIERELGELKKILMLSGSRLKSHCQMTTNDYLLLTADACFLIRVEGVRNNIRKSLSTNRIKHSAKICSDLVGGVERFLTGRGIKREVVPVVLLSRRRATPNDGGGAVMVTNVEPFRKQLSSARGLGKKEQERLAEQLIG